MVLQYILSGANMCGKPVRYIYKAFIVLYYARFPKKKKLFDCIFIFLLRHLHLMLVHFNYLKLKSGISGPMVDPVS